MVLLRFGISGGQCRLTSLKERDIFTKRLIPKGFRKVEKSWRVYPNFAQIVFQEFSRERIPAGLLTNGRQDR